MEITNNYLQLQNTTAKQNLNLDTNSIVKMNNCEGTNVQTNSDVFVKSNSSDNTGIYSFKDVSPITSKSELLTSKTSAVSLNSSSTPKVCLDTIKRAAARKAGIYLSASGVPSINGGTEARLYFEEISRINNCFYCQTGGWSKLPGYGEDGCERTAAATMVSINSGITVTPDDTLDSGNYLSGIVVNGITKTRTPSQPYSITTGAAQGLCEYSCGSEKGVIAAINNELKAGRSVMVRTNVDGGHWVTVTGTIDGNYADSFKDFVGIDPWYNGKNPGNPSTGTGNYATKESRAGIIQLGDVKDQTLSSEYRIITYKP